MNSYGSDEGVVVFTPDTADQIGQKVAIEKIEARCCVRPSKPGTPSAGHAFTSRVTT